MSTRIVLIKVVEFNCEITIERMVITQMGVISDSMINGMIKDYLHSRKPFKQFSILKG